MRQIKINSTTGSEIVTTSDFKSYARINYTDDDSMIAKILVKARIWCENYISRDIVAKNRTYYLDSTQGVFDLPFGPVASISSVTIDGVANTDFTTPGLDNETVDIDGPGDKVKVTYITSGLDDNLLEQAILQLASTYYDFRHDFEVGKAVNIIPTSVKDILNSYKNMFI
tara:strand:+ start:24002 stop:24511 length:510 start_codon:yes stop_codon:yes gene_type:complete